MKGIRLLGDYIVEFLIVTLLVVLSAATVVFLIPVLVGLNAYFKNNKNERMFRDIFITIKKNYKIIIFYTIFELLILVFPIMNIYFFNTNPEKLNYVLLAISYIALFIGGIYLTTGPTIIVNMNVNFFQLLYNGFMLLFGSLLRSLISMLVVAGFFALILLYPYVVVATLYLMPLIVTKLMKENFYVLKARVLGTNVYTLKANEKKDDYLDDMGNVKH